MRPPAHKTMLAILVLLGGAMALVAAALKAQPPATPPAGWRLDRVALQTGKKLEGLVLTEDRRKGTLEFAEVVRPPGRPMFAVIRTLALAQCQKIERLSAAEREISLQRLRAFRNRARIELGRMDQIALQPSRFEGRDCRRYNGAWFSLWSTCDQETTRRCIVRTEQIFAAYRQLLPPRAAQGRLRILLLGTLDEYGDFLEQNDLELKNPAFYSARENLIVMASDLTAFSRRLQAMRREHSAARTLLERQQREFPQRFAELSQQLRKAGYSGEQVARERKAREKAWRDAHDQQLRRIAEVGRRNDAAFRQLTARMFQRLYHEAFHAYLENFVFPRRRHDIPRWYNEGLAQIFENGQLDADLLRIDAPVPRLLKRLQQDLRGGEPLALEALVRSEPRRFVQSHEQPDTERFYLYAWGLAYSLTFHDRIPPQRLEAFVSLEAKTGSPQARFERLVGMSLKKYEAAWRQQMLALRAR